MCRLSKEMEKNGDHIASMNTGNVQANVMTKDKNADQREMIKSNKNKIQEEDELPAELQHALHLSSSVSDADSTPQKAHSNNTSASEGSLTSASPQSTIQHTRTPHTHTHTHHHHHANHLHVNNSLQHDYHYTQDHNRMANHHHNLEHHSHQDNDDDHQNYMHADASLDSSGCNSTHMFSSMLLNSDATTDDCERAAAPFFLPKNAWMASSSSALEEPTFFSSSIVNGSLGTPNDLSLMSTSMSKSSSTLHTHDNAHQRTHPFLNNNMQFMEAAGNFHQVSSDHNASMMMNDLEYGHYTNVPSFSSFLAASPSCLQPEKASHHVDFLGAGDGNGAGGAECNIYQSQMYMQQAGADDAVAYMQYQNAGQAQNWHGNAMQQESNEGAYACYWASTPQGMVPVMPSASGPHGSSYVFNAMELQQAEQYYNAHQQGGHQGTPMLTHSQSVPLYLEHFGSTHQSMSMGDQRVQIALNGGGAEGYGSSISEFRGGAVRSQLRKTKEISSCSSGMELEDQGPHAEHSWVDGVGAAHWRSAGPHRLIKGMARHSNKRSSPDGEEEESVHKSAPPLKRSASWDSMGLQYNNKHSSSPLNEHHMPMNMMKGSMNAACKSTSPKQDKPRARQGIANDPQSIAARHRRERISERLKILQQLVPNGSKVDLVTMLEKAINYVKFLQLQVKVLATDEYWPTPLNKFPKVAAMAKLAADSKEPANLEKVEKALADTIQATSIQATS